MKSLILKKLVIISQKDEEAKIIEFHDKLNIITSDNPDGITINRTGKSLIIKSIYHSMGAKLKKYPSNWSTLQIATIMTFKYDNKNYEIYRNRDSFIFRDDQETKFFRNLSELRDCFVDLFSFYIRMPIKEGDENVVYAYPGAIFMPFYVDQDTGWSGTWDSFKDIFSGKWKTEILLYHMGIRTRKYYDLMDEKIDLSAEQKENKREFNTVATVIRNHTEKYGDYLDINIEIDKFAEDIVHLTEELTIQLKRKNVIKEELISCFTEMRELEELYSVADKAYKELVKDIDYVETQLEGDEVVCPACGTAHKNSIENRFYMYSEIEECEQVIQDYFEQRSKIEKRVQKQSDELKQLEDYIAKIDTILNRRRSEITFKEIIIAEGSKSILDDMRNEQSNMQGRLDKLEARLKEISNEQRAISKEGTNITKLYLEKLSTALGLLNVADINESELKKFKASFNSGGNDLPCAVLAQIYTLYSISARHSSTVCAPLVLDAIFQQEPAKEKISTIWDYVINQQPVNSQLILSTTEINGRNFSGKLFRLTKERGLLSKHDYLNEESNIKWYKSLLIESLKKVEAD